MVLCLALHLGASATVAAKSAGKSKKPSAAKNATLANALGEKSAQVQKCAIDNALEKGAKRVDINVRVTINRAGAVIDSRVTASADGVESAPVKSCVEQVVKTAKFPTISTSLATSEKSWTIAQQ